MIGVAPQAQSAVSSVDRNAVVHFARRTLDAMDVEMVSHRLSPNGRSAIVAGGMPDLSILDAALRGAAIVLLLMLAALLLRDHGRSQAARIGAVFAIGVAAYAVCAAPAVATLRVWWHAPLLALASGNAVVFWLFARALFDDGFVPRAWHALPWAGFALATLTCFFLLPTGSPVGSALGIALAVGRVGFAALAVGQTLATWRNDLVEGRRRLRGFIVGAVALHIAVDTLSGLAMPGFGSAIAGVINAATLAVMTAVIAWPLLRVDGDGLFPLPSPPATATPARAQPDAPPASPDAGLVAALQRLMTVERIQRREGLTIGALANRLGLPEYRVRRLINQGLGFRNFNAFLNHHRIQEAKQALADPAQADVPVLTIALDAGFQSLGPFNRAFKAETGLTPSEYRRAGGAAAKPNPLAQQANFEISQSA